MLTAALAVSSVAVAACGSAGSDAGENVELVIYSQAGSLEELFAKTVIPNYEEANPGITIEQVPGTSGDNISKTIAQRGSPQADLIFVNDVSIPLGKEAGVLAKLDTEAIPNLADVYEVAKDPDGYGVAFGITTTTLAYNTEVFEAKGWDPPDSWEDLLDPKYKGHVVIHDMSNGFGSSFLAAWNLELGGTYSSPEPVFDKVRNLLPNLLTLATDASGFDNAFKNGSGWIGENGATRIAVLTESGVPVETAYPDSGAVFITGTAAIPEGAKDAGEAAKFLNYILQPDVQIEIARTQNYSPTNTKTVLPPDVAKKVPSGEDFIESLTILDWNVFAEALQDWTTEWNTEVLGS